MKKVLIRIGIVLLVLIVVAVLAIGFFLDGAVKRGVEIVGPKITKVAVKLDAVSLSILSGSGKVKGLVIGNPEGFKSAEAIKVGKAGVALSPGSLLSDKIVVRSISVEEPEITFEGSLHGNNLSKLLANVDSASGGGDKSTSDQQKASKKLQVDDFVIKGARVHVSLTELGGKGATVPIPEIHLTNLGTGPEGITPAELTKKVLQAVVSETEKAASTVLTDFGKGALNLTKEVGTNASGTVQKATKSIGGLFKKEKKN